MRLDTMPAMTEARALYHRLGFVSINPYGSKPLPGAVHMELALRPDSDMERQTT
jgi:hypothetical protein